MAVGDKLPVVMGKEKAAANGVATLGADGKLAEEQRPTPTEAGAADLTLSNLSNRQKALRNIGGRPNRNLLDNAHLAGGGSQQGGGQLPINQRGQTSYEAMGIAIDRWNLYNGVTLTLESGGIQISRIASSSVDMLIQVLPVSDWTRIAGMPVTLSALINGKLGSVSFTFPTNMDALFDGPELVVDNLLADIYGIPNHNSCRVRFFSDKAAAWTIQASKLELGDTQTLAYQDESGNWQLFETPDYAEELAKCQRYYEQTYRSVFFAVANSASQIDYAGSLVFSVQKRIAPTSTVNPNPLQNLSVQDASNGFTPVSGCALQIPTAYNRNMIAPRVTGNFTIGHIYRITIPDNAYIISAEL